MAQSETPCVAAILVQDSDGERICAKFYDKAIFGDKAHQAEFERRLFKKTQAALAASGAGAGAGAGAAAPGGGSTPGGGPAQSGAGAAAGGGLRAGESDILLLDGLTVVFRAGIEVTLAVVGDGDENELILVAVLDALYDSLSMLLKGAVDKREVLAHLELLLLAIDELVDGGVPFEVDPHAIEARVMLRGAVPESTSSYNEMTLGQLADKARDKLAKQFAK